MRNGRAHELVVVLLISVLQTQGQSIDDQLNNLIQDGLATEIWSEDLEDLSFDDSGVCSGNCPEVLQDSEGAFMRTTLCGTMDNTYRTELHVVDRADLWIEEGTYVIRFNARFNPTGPATLEKRSMFVQLHTINTSEDLSVPRWQPIGGRVNVDAGDGFWECERLKNEYHSTDFTYQDNTWYEYVIIISLSRGAKGQVICYRNGVKQFEALGANSGQWRYPLHPKFGVYSGSNQVGSANYSQGCRTIDFDDMRVIKLGRNFTNSTGCEAAYPITLEHFE